MASVDGSDLSAALPSDTLVVPTALHRSDDFRSTNAQHNEPSAPITGYEDLNLSILPRGFTIAVSSLQKDSWVWNHGYRLDDKNGIEYWVCKRCHKAKSHRNHRFQTARQTSTAGDHMKNEHRIDKLGNMDDSAVQHVRKKRKVTDRLSLPAVSLADCDSASRRAAEFSAVLFKSLLLQWLIMDNISFRKCDSSYFRRLLSYLNPLCDDSMPDHTTLSRWILKAYEDFVPIVIECLQTAIGLIHFSFDLWTSSNGLALAGVVVHFVDKTGKVWDFLLGLPAHHEDHTGYNIAQTISSIFTHFGLRGSQLGYFTSDNATNNDTCIDWLAAEFDFVAAKRRVRCAGHIINLVCKAVMVGWMDLEVFEQDLLSMAQEARDALEVWRRRGPVGKLHNIIVYISRSPQRMDKLRALQKQAIADGLQFTDRLYQLVRDNDTRWNSLFAMIERARLVREAITDFVIQEVTRWHEYMVRWHTHNDHLPEAKRKKMREPPSIVADQLTLDDWTVLDEYFRILKPCKEATIRLQGQVGGHGHIWEVLPVLDWLLTHFEEAKKRYAVEGAEKLPAELSEVPHLAQEHHYIANINLAWKKLDQYYAKTDETPIYLAAVVLHPRYNWAWVLRHWGDKPDWIKAGEKALLALWQEYRDQPSAFDDVRREDPSLSTYVKGGRHQRRRTEVDEEMATFGYSSDEDTATRQAPADQWKEYTHLDSNHHIKDPFEYWYSRRHRWPQLARMGLEILSIPPMSDEPERTFSDSGCMVTDRRNRLKEGTIGAISSLKSWTRKSVITWDIKHLRKLTTAAEERHTKEKITLYDSMSTWLNRANQSTA